ncbi:NAD(P)-binding domain-containing protein, partial [Streptomyces sp. NPDC050804]
MPADLAVIGLGHLGLPLAQAAVAAGVDTIGYDTDPWPVAELAAGHPPVEGSLTASEIRRMLSGGFRPTTNPTDLGRVRTAVICVPTPLGADRTPDLGAVGEAARA